MSDLARRLRRLCDEHTHRRGRRDAILETISLDEARAAEHEAEAAELDKAVEVLQAATETRRQELRDRVETLVTRGLHAVFRRDDFEFAFKVSLRRDVFGVVPVLRSKFGEQVLETEIVDGRAGGIADVVSFLLRVIVLCLARPKVAPVLVLDESFSHVSTDLLRGVAVLLRELSESAGIQLLLVTHKPELLDAADVIYRAELVDGATEFRLEHCLRDESFHRRPRRGERAPERGSMFDHEDLVAATNDSETRHPEPRDKLAHRQQYPYPPWPGTREEREAETRKKKHKRLVKRDKMRRYRAKRKEREAADDGPESGV